MHEMDPIRKSCNDCPRKPDASFLLEVQVPDENDEFNTGVFLDIMRLVLRRMLHAVDDSSL